MYVYAPNQTVQTYPYSESMFRAARRAEGVSCRRLADMTEEQRNSFDVYTVQPAAMPASPGSKIEEGDPAWNVDHFEQLWIVSAYPPAELDAALAEAKASMLRRLKSEAISRISAKYPDLDSLGSILLERERWLSIAPAARQPTADYQYLIDVAGVFNATRSQLLLQTDLAAIEVYDVSAGPSWPPVP